MRSNEVSVTNNDRNLVSGFDRYTCSGDSICDIFENKYEIITENSIVWFNTNKSICQGKVIKIPSGDFPHYYNHLKLIWMDTKKEDKVLI